MPAPRLAGEEAKAAMATIVGKARNEVPVSAKVLASYAGVYELTPTFQLSVDLKDGVLHVQATNQPAFPVYPESDTTFFFKVVDAQIHFVKDAKGAVSKLILHQGGLEQTAKKVK